MGIWAFNLNISSHFCVHRVKFVYLTTYLIKAGMKIEKIKLRTIRYIEIQRFEIYPISLFSWGRTVLGNQRSSTYSVF